MRKHEISACHRAANLRTTNVHSYLRLPAASRACAQPPRTGAHGMACAECPPSPSLPSGSHRALQSAATTVSDTRLRGGLKSRFGSNREATLLVARARDAGLIFHCVEATATRIQSTSMRATQPYWKREGKGAQTANSKQYRNA